MPSASDPRQPNRQGQPAPRPVQAGQRSVQPMPRPAQPCSHAARPPSERLSSQLPVRRSPLAALVLSSRLLRNAHRLLNRSLMRITPAVRMALLRRPARATTRILVAVLKRRALRFP